MDHRVLSTRLMPKKLIHTCNRLLTDLLSEKMKVKFDKLLIMINNMIESTGNLLQKIFKLRKIHVCLY